jgi:hypothetical protein
MVKSLSEASKKRVYLTPSRMSTTVSMLKNLHVMGFMGFTGQLEFLLHAMENAPALEVLIVDPYRKIDEDNQGIHSS